MSYDIDMMKDSTTLHEKTDSILTTAKNSEYSSSSSSRSSSSSSSSSSCKCTDNDHSNRATSRNTSTSRSMLIMFLKALFLGVGMVSTLYHEQFLERTQANVSTENVILIVRSLVVVFTSLGLYMYFLVKRHIDETYTSYKSGVDYGLSNVEKGVSRRDAMLTLQYMLGGVTFLFALHLLLQEIWPCFFGPIVVIMCILSNDDYVDCLAKGYIKRMPRSTSGRFVIPRSTSGRLM